MSRRLLVGLIGLVMASAMTGCATQLQAVSAAQSSSAVALRAAEDIHLKRVAFELCATPVSAAIRNPQVIPAIRAMCLPGGGESSPALLLEGMAK